VFYDGPLVVLTSRFSASASEILAGALQDYGRALIVGDSSTHGKGTVQSLLELRKVMRNHTALSSSNDPGALKITIRKFYRASGASTQLKGVVPDIVLPSIYNYAEVGEASLENPLPWDTIQPASYDKLNRVEPVLGELKRRSEVRVGSDPDFNYLREEIERFKKNLSDKTISLNEAQRLKEKEEADQRAKARKKELAARPEPAGKTYELTLKLADQPGLPPPVTKTNAVKTASVMTPSGRIRVQRPESAKSDKPAEKADADADSAEDEIHDEPSTNLDIAMEEAKRILLDFIALSRGNSLAGTGLN